MICVYMDAEGVGLSWQDAHLPDGTELFCDRPHIIVTDPALIERIKMHGQHGRIEGGQIVIPTDVEIEAIEAERRLAAARAQLAQAVQRHLDDTARTRNYDGILSLCTYATSSNPKFSAEGQAGVTWRDAVWAECYRLLDEVLAGEREVPSEQELIDLLPIMQWPDDEL